MMRWRGDRVFHIQRQVEVLPGQIVSIGPVDRWVITPGQTTTGAVNGVVCCRNYSLRGRSVAVIRPTRASAVRTGEMRDEWSQESIKLIVFKRAQAGHPSAILLPGASMHHVLIPPPTFDIRASARLENTTNLARGIAVLTVAIVHPHSLAVATQYYVFARNRDTAVPAEGNGDL